MNINKTSICHVLSLILLCLMQNVALAETRIAILEFELIDLTLAPRTPSEIKRTASIKPLLETELRKLSLVLTTKVKSLLIAVLGIYLIIMMLLQS